MIDSSHSYEMVRINNVLEWKFKNIQLQPQSVNEDLSKGYVTFQIKTNSGIQPNNTITNNASIYFDTNPVINTNNFQTLFVSSLGLNNYLNDNIKLFPIPVNNILNINSKYDYNLIEVYDLVGKKVFSSIYSNNIDLSILKSGIYILSLISQEGNITTQKIVKN